MADVLVHLLSGVFLVLEEVGVDEGDSVLVVEERGVKEDSDLPGGDFGLTFGPALFLRGFQGGGLRGRG